MKNEQKSKAQLIEELEGLYMLQRTMLDSTPDGIITTDPNFVIRSWNRAAAKLYGWSAEEAIGRQMGELIPTEFIDSNVDDVRSRLFAEGAWGGEVIQTRKDGGQIFVQASISLVTDAADRPIMIASINRDISDRKHVEEELIRVTEDWQTTFDATRDAIFLLDQNQRILRCNKETERLYQCPPGELIGKHCWEIVHGTSQPIPECPFLIMKQSLHRETMELKIDQRYFQVTVDPLLDATGELLGAVHAISDITERKQMEELLRLKNLVFDSSIGANSISDAKGIITEANQAFLDVWGYAGKDEVVGKPISHFLLSDEDTEKIVTALSTTGTWTGEYIARKKDGSTFVARSLATTLRATDGELVGYQSSVIDITEHSKAERTLRESEEKYRGLFENISSGVAIYEAIDNGKDFIFKDFNKGGEIIENIARADLIGKSVAEVFPGIREFGLLDVFRRVWKTGKPESLPISFYQDDRIIGWRENFVFRLPSGEIVTVYDDITARKQAEEALLESEEIYRVTAQKTGQIVYEYNPATGKIKWEGAIEALTGQTYEDFQSVDIDAWALRVHDEDRKAVVDALDIAQQECSTYDVEYRFRQKNGSYLFIEEHGIFLPDSEGKAVRMLGSLKDITERKQAEKQLSSEKTLLKAIIDNIPVLLTHYDPDTNMLYLNNEFEKVVGWTTEEVRNIDMMEKVYPDPDYRKQAMDYMQRTGAEWREFRLQSKSGKVIDSEWSNIRLDDGTQIGIGIDITKRKQAEEQFHQAQKMESVGRLAGGVAHDFNNMLTAIIGFSEVIRSALDSNDPLVEDVQEILNAAGNAAQLTRQLLAFSRKQTIDPRVIDINEIIEHSSKMLGRIIEEDIELLFVPGKDLGSIKADPGQIDQILVNLAVNARDAMPGGGKLTVETQNVELEDKKCHKCSESMFGSYVMLAISDNGCGMEKEILDHIFEPFFTTKRTGEGTGLGLSTVFGIVHQHSGHINVYSEPGEGTTFKIYLPRVDEEVEAIARPVEQASVTGTETILLVEDDDMVRKLACRLLEKSGYHVLEAENGGEAYLICKDFDQEIHLLFTDVVMPNLNGKEVYEQIAEMRPKIKVLYMSGYTENAIAHRGVLEEGTLFLHKPFQANALLTKVREALDS
jgi:PAS domain S-box-containing protein